MLRAGIGTLAAVALGLLGLNTSDEVAAGQQKDRRRKTRRDKRAGDNSGRVQTEKKKKKKKRCPPCKKPKKGKCKGTLPDGASCPGGTCRGGSCCMSRCEGKVCGDDSCGGSCGDCGADQSCQDGQCLRSCGGTICRFDHASAFCQGGTCALGSCHAGWGNCDGDPANGCETDIRTDVNNCGGCNTQCNTTNATPDCVDGSCRVTCHEGFANCDGSAFTGCEIDTRTDADHCGACNHRCQFPNAGAFCEDGTCVLGPCGDRRTGTFVWANCDDDPNTGCETDIMNDSAHCGGCHQACSDGQECFSGVCELPCGEGGPCRVFVTATVYTGNLGGLAGADERCQNRAESAHLPGTYMAWLSDASESPDTRFSLKSTGPYWTVDRVAIADDWDDLTDGTLAATIFVTEGVATPGGFFGVWTHTQTDGTAGGVGNAHCHNWTSAGAGGGDAGWCGLDTAEWTENNATDCFLHKRLYCFQQS
jgi:hypothetical protein